jgi:hypothetical protein
MKKGKTLALLVLALEIATITILHAVKISQNEKPAKESGNAQTENRTRSNYSLALYR